MSEQDRSGEALGQPAAPQEQVKTVESVVLGSTVEVSDPPEAVPHVPQSLRRDLGEKISDIFGRMGDPEDPDDELTDLEEKFRAGLRAEEEISEARLELLRQECKDLAESNDHAFGVLRQRSHAIGEMDKRLAEREDDIAALDAQLEAKKAALARAHEALVKLGEKGGTAEEIEAVMTEIDPEAAEKLVAARHELREPKPVEPVEPPVPTEARGELTTRMAKPRPTEVDTAPVETPAELTQTIQPMGEADDGEEKTQPYNVQVAEFSEPGSVAYDPQAPQTGQPKVPRYVARMQAMGVDPAQIAQHWPTQQ